MAFVFSVTSAYAFIDSYKIERKNLPEEAQQMLKDYFPKAKVSLIKVDRHLLKKTDYDVRLTNGTKIEFSNKGKWTSVDCGSPNIVILYFGRVLDNLRHSDSQFVMYFNHCL